MSKRAEKASVRQTDVSFNKVLDQLLKSASLTQTDAYRQDSKLNIQMLKHATTFFEAVKWDVLAHLSSSLRDGEPCEYSESIWTTEFSMFRRIVFEDGKHWVARLTLPALEPAIHGYKKLDVTSALEIEIASMKFMKAKTSIPVPKVHSYDVDPTNEVGAPYILMDYICGKIASELRESKNCKVGLFGTPDQDKNFSRQVANIQAELSSHKFDQIGSLYLDEETQEFFIGSEIETGKGPWGSSMDYFNDLVNHSLKRCAANAEPQVTSGASFTLPVLFKELISTYGHVSCQGPFSLTSRNLGAHNILVNDDFKVVSVFGFDAVMAAPMEAVAQYPQILGLDRQLHGRAEAFVSAIEYMNRSKPRVEEYQGFVRGAEIRFKRSGGSSRRDTNETPVLNTILSDAATLFQGLRQYAWHQKAVNDRWMDHYLTLLRKRLTHA